MKLKKNHQSAWMATLMTGVALTHSLAADNPRLTLSTPEQTDLKIEGVEPTADEWIRLIEKAKSTIDIEQFYVASKPQSSLEPVLGALENAIKRQVKVRLILSNELLDEDKVTFARLKQLKGLELRVLDLSELMGGIVHTKVWVFDRETVYVGSANFDYRALSHIHELGAIVTDKAIAKQLSSIFDFDWELAQKEKPTLIDAKKLIKKFKWPTKKSAPRTPTQLARYSKLPIELVASPEGFIPPGTRSGIEALTSLIDSAKKSLSIQVLYLSPIHNKTEYWNELDTRLRAAASRGVQVQLLVSDWTSENSKQIHLKSLAQIPNIQVKMVSIPQAKNEFIPYARVIHSKYCIVDGQTLWIGTSNWSKDYFYFSRNIDLIFRSKVQTKNEAITQLIKNSQLIYDKLWNSAFAATLDINKMYVMPKRSEK